MKDKKHTIAADSMSAFENKQKSRRGILRIWHASHYSIQGLRAGWNEPAFRLESVFSFVLVPLAFWLGQGWVEVALLRKYPYFDDCGATQYCCGIGD